MLIKFQLTVKNDHSHATIKLKLKSTEGKRFLRHAEKLTVAYEKATV